VRTLDKVIRREFKLAEGDAFNTAKLKRSEERIRNLNFFKKVEVTNAPGSAPDRTVVTAQVEEQSTGELSLGGGFSTTDGPIGNTSISEHNLLGRGQDLRVGLTLSGRAQQVDLSYTEPYFLGHNIAAGVDLYQIDQKNQLNATYDQFTLGMALRAGYQVSEYLRNTWRYTLRTDSIDNVQSGASLFIIDAAGSRLTSSVGQVLLYDRRDNIQDPTSGYLVSIGTDLAGFGGDVRYVRTKLNGGWFYGIAPGYVVSTTGEAGYIAGLGQAVNIQDRWFVGGDNLHGFATAGIGPRDIVTGDALGGNMYYVGSLSLGFPLGLPQEFGVAGRVFTDVGDLWSFDLLPNDVANGRTKSAANDINSVRMSAGFGVSWKSPFGPIRLDLATPILRQAFDKSEFFRISFGTRF
jgi:outer membrane protein insertion porin family